MRNKQASIAIVAIALLAVTAAAMPHPRADIRILTHESADRSPARLQAALDLGIVAVSVVVTWTRRVAA